MWENPAHPVLEYRQLDKNYPIDPENNKNNKGKFKEQNIYKYNVKFLYTNICCMNNKLDIININIDEIKPDILSCVETRYSNVLEIEEFETYESFHKLQKGRKTGGIGTWCKSNLKPKKLDLHDIEDNISNHILWVLCQKAGPLAICTVYLLNQGDREASETNRDILNRLNSNIEWCQRHNYAILIMGDFNAHIGNDEWGIPGNHRDINQNGVIVREFIENNEIHLANANPITKGIWTWGARRLNTNQQILDLVMHDDNIRLKTMEIDEDNIKYGTGRSDHCFILGTIESKNMQINEDEKQNPQKTRWNIDEKQNWDIYKTEINNAVQNIDIRADAKSVEQIISITKDIATKVLGIKENRHKKWKYP